ncbi:MAG: hypothetical protein ACOX1H_05560 [Pseudoramibacter sp.]
MGSTATDNRPAFYQTEGTVKPLFTVAPSAGEEKLRAIGCQRSPLDQADAV